MLSLSKPIDVVEIVVLLQQEPNSQLAQSVCCENCNRRYPGGGIRDNIETANGEQIVDKVSAGPDLMVKIGQTVQADQP